MATFTRSFEALRATSFPSYDRDYWEQSGGVYIDASAQRDIFTKSRRLPTSATQVSARVPLIGYRGAYRLAIAGDAAAGQRIPFLLRCQVFENDILGIELKQSPEAPVRLVGRPILGYCAKDIINGYFGDKFSHDSNLAAIRTYIDPMGAAIVTAETDAGTMKILDGVAPNEASALAMVCLGVYLAKCRTATQLTP